MSAGAGSFDDDPLVNELIARYLQLVESGESIDPEEFLREHPEHAHELREFLADKRRFDALAEGAADQIAGKHSLDDPTLPPVGTVDLNAPTLEPGSSRKSALKSAFRPGTIIRYFGDYELLSEIARGGMGVVYKARQVKLNRLVALKMILAGQLASKEDVQRFYTEAEAAAGLDHPGIVPIFEVGEHEGQHYFSMAFVDGESLSSRLSHSPLAPLEAAELVRKIAQAIQYAHDRGVIHRDLKPANVLLQATNGSSENSDSIRRTAASSSPSVLQLQPKVTDFGLAKKIGSDSNLTGTGQILGTPSYMSPEQAAGKITETKEPADIYALGAILYAALTGRPPFQADNPLDTLMQVLEREPVSPRQLNPNVPRDLETICLKCLEKDRRRRYPSATALADDLQRFVNGEPVLARPVAAPERIWRWCRRRPTQALASGLALASTLAALVILSVAVVLVSNSRNEERTARSKEEVQRTKAEEQLKQSQRLLYVSQISSAAREWETSNVNAAWNYLNATNEALRGWEYDYLRAQFEVNQTTFKGHTGAVRSVAYSPDGRLVASGSWDHSVRVWDVASGQNIRTLIGHTNWVTSVAFSPDGKSIASGSYDNSVIVWNAGTGQKSLTFSGHQFAVSTVSFSPDGNWIASGGGNDPRRADSESNPTIRVWNAANGQQRLTLVGHRGDIRDIDFSPDGSRIVSCSGDNIIKLWDAGSGAESLTLTGHTSWGVNCVAFSPDSQRIVSGGSDQTLRIWDAISGKQIEKLAGHTAEVYGVAFSPDGKRIASSSGAPENAVRLWNTTDGRTLGALKSHTAEVYDIAFSPDGKWIASASGDQSLKIWDVASRQETPTLVGHQSELHCVAFSPDGKWIASGSGNYEHAVRLWNATNGAETHILNGHSDHISSVTFSPDSKRMVTGSWDQTIRVWDLTSNPNSSGRIITEYYQSNAALSPDGMRIAVGSHDGIVKVWDAFSHQKILSLNGHRGQISSVAFSPDGKRIASGGSDNSVIVWNAETGQQLLTFSGHPWGIVQCIAFSPDGKWIASGGNSKENSLLVWNARNGDLVHTLGGNTSSGGVNSIAFSPDGKRIASGGYDQKIRLWEAASGQEVFVLKGHTDFVESVAFSADGQRLASASRDRTVKIWDASKGSKFMWTGNRNSSGVQNATVQSEELAAGSSITGEKSDNAGSHKVKARNEAEDLKRNSDSELAAFAPLDKYAAVVSAGRLRLATATEVQADLAMTDEQKSVANMLWEAYLAEQIANQPKFTFPKSQSEVMEKMDADIRKQEQKIAEFVAKMTAKLTAVQQSRLTQIYVQLKGYEAIEEGDAEIAKAIGLTAEQIAKLSEVRRANREQIVNTTTQLMGKSDEKKPSDMNKIIAAWRVDASQRVLKCLTEKQKTAFKELYGKPIEIDMNQFIPPKKTP